MLSEVQELAEIISPRMTGKKYSELDFMHSLKEGTENERYRVCAEAQSIRMEALKLAKARGRTYERMKWPELLEFCEIVMEQRGLIREPGED